MYRLILSAFLLLFLSACATDKDGSRTTTGQYLGQAEWQEIDISESKLSANKRVRQAVKKVYTKSLPNRRQERVIFNGGGYALLEWMYRGGFRMPPSNPDFIKLFAGTNLRGTPITPNELAVQSQGTIKYSFLTRGTRHCISFVKALGRTLELRGGIGREAYVRGLDCSAPDDTSYKTDILAMLASVTFER
ncbi:hypothetical protein [Terasakiella pusilla]|uniref:hypothetical protein n=1 Tax=Terasakiella pusilla TaxID=64973 RepID=UPI003AA92E80